MTARVFVRPAPGLKVRSPADPRRHIAEAGEVMVDTLDLRRLAAAGDVIITAEGAESAPPAAEPAPPRKAPAKG
jgi:hypothetical protein